MIAGVAVGVCMHSMFKHDSAGGKKTGGLLTSFMDLGEAAQYDDTCHNSWVLTHVNAEMQRIVEEKNAAWYDALPKILEGAYDKNTLARAGNGGDPIEPLNWNRFDVMMPPVEGACEMQRIGLKDGDGGKFVCGIQDIPDNKDRPCIIYSIGSNHVWDFEEDAYNSTRCTIHTFDCTVQSNSMPEYIRDRATFHKICMGSSENSSEGKIFMNLKEVMDMLGHSYVTLLKADIEGFEFDLFNEILTVDEVELPEQISFELHYRTIISELPWMPRQKTAGEIALLGTRLYEQGYRVLSREDNVLCPHCTEITIARFRCPKGPRSQTKKLALRMQERQRGAVSYLQEQQQ